MWIGLKLLVVGFGSRFVYADAGRNGINKVGLRNETSIGLPMPILGFTLSVALNRCRS